MKIVTWNINGIRARIDNLLGWLRTHEPDVLCLQETKTPDADFPRLEIEAEGYQVEFFGQKAYNGVAILSRHDITEVERGFPGDGADADKRVLAATIGGIRIVNLYVPNGSRVGSDKYEMKLRWLDILRDMLTTGRTPSDPLLVCGDYNIAPEDRDVHDPDVWRGKVLCSEPEREQYRKLLEWGFVDALRRVRPEDTVYTWWDYRMGMFRRNLGLRIDHFLVTPPVAERVLDVTVDREARGGEKPSDHAPVVAELEA